MGSVWRARHLELASPVAVKFTTASDPKTISRFQGEAQTAAKLKNPHIVQVHDVGQVGPLPFLVMELLDGESLSERIQAEGRVSLDECRLLLRQVARGLQAAHQQGVVHRDLKPSNVFLVSNADTFEAKILDFGVARIADSHRTQTGDFFGTPHYMSPEQASDPRRVTAQSDLWSLALLVYECLVGKRAVTGQNVAQALHALNQPLPVPSEEATLPRGIDAWFLRATARAPEDRFESAWEMLEAFEAACQKPSAALRRTPHPRVWLLAGACAALGGSAALWSTLEGESTVPSVEDELSSPPITHGRAKNELEAISPPQTTAHEVTRNASPPAVGEAETPTAQETIVSASSTPRVKALVPRAPAPKASTPQAPRTRPKQLVPTESAWVPTGPSREEMLDVRK